MEIHTVCTLYLLLQPLKIQCLRIIAKDNGDSHWSGGDF